MDFWPGFDFNQDWVFNFLIKNFNIEVSDNPDFLFYSSFGKSHLKYSCYKVFYCAENIRPNYLECDFSLCYDFNDNKNHYRLPLYGALQDCEPEQVVTNSIVERDYLVDKKFCCYLSSNANTKFRDVFFNELCKYKKVDSGGLVNNNIGFRVEDKFEFIKNYKFIIAFENSSYNGYVTEKIWHGFFKKIIPIYWGSPSVNLDFNTKRFINYNDYGSIGKVIDKIIELDNDDDLYIKMVNEPIFPNGSVVNKFIDRKNILEFFTIIFSSSHVPVSKTWKREYAFIKRKYKGFKVKIKRFIK